MSDPAAPLRTEIVRYDDRIVRDFVIATLVWGVVGMLVGVIIACQLFAPGLNFDQPWLSYGRLRPLHTNAVIFAFAGNGIFAGAYYALPRLLKAPMWSRRLSLTHFWGWQLIIVAAAVTLPLGITTSKEYSELEWPIDIAIAAVWIVFGLNMFATIFTRRERHLYVAVWFFIATWLGITMLHVVNSLAMPVSFTKSYPFYAGIQDALVQWWYGHNAVAFFLTTPFLGLMYYYMPKAAERPVYSYRLSIVHFWSLIFIYIWAGPHHLLNAATPEWAQTLGVVFSVVLIAPSWGGMINGLLTLRGAFDKVRKDPVLKFLVAAVTFYGMATFEGPLLSLREVNALSHNTDWTIGHVHSGALGWVALLLFGMIYWLAPRLWKTKLYSEGLANLHFWIAMIGIVVYTVTMWISGIATGWQQLQVNESGEATYKFSEMVQFTIPFYWARAAGGALFLVGVLVMCWNIWRTACSGAGPVSDPEVQVPARLPDPDFAAEAAEVACDPALKPRARFIKLHDIVERWPTALIILSAIALAIGGLCQIVPQMIQGALTPKIAAVKPYTPLELAGRDLYIREGCNACHTQMVRTLRSETERYRGNLAAGQYTLPGEHIYDRPHLWGSKRTGPDLAREGAIRPSAVWHFRHFRQPRSLFTAEDKPGFPASTMPAYPWFIANAIDLDELPVKLGVLARAPLYTPYSPREIRGAADDARSQARVIWQELQDGRGDDADIANLPDPTAGEVREILAMIAYMKRLGTDIARAPEQP